MKRLVALVLTLVVAVGLCPPATAAPDAGPRNVHPLVTKAAKENPRANVNVIVQMKQGYSLDDGSLPKGAKKKADAAFVNAYSLNLTAEAALELSNRSDVKYISPDAPLVMMAKPSTVPTGDFIQASGLSNPDLSAVLTGNGIGVAVLDTGVSKHPDLRRNKVDVAIQGVDLGAYDDFGHGTHIAGIIAGNSRDGAHQGIAPGAMIHNIKITDNNGVARESDLLAGLQWVFANHRTQGIHVVNISCQSMLPQSYLTSPICAAVEALWMDGVVVVVSAGNKGNAEHAMYYPPANDPYVITVGATSDNGTDEKSDDYVPSWSSRGISQDGVAKPDVLAPGHRIVGPLAGGSKIAELLTDRIVDDAYIRLSGTSMSAGVVSGMVADILSVRRDLSPDQVKHILMSQADGRFGTPSVDATAIYDYLMANRLTRTPAIPSANQGLTPNVFVTQAAGGAENTNVFFDNVFFDNVFFDNVFFDNVFFDNVFFDNVFFN